MSKIFICYRREDSIEIVGRMNSWLSMRLPGGEVFIDVHTIIPGVNYRDLVEHTLTFDAAIVLVVIGKTWANIVGDQGVKRLDEPDDPVRQEIELAFDHKKHIIPILVQSASMPKREELPPSIASLAEINALSVRSEPDFENDMRRLREAMVAYDPSLLEFHPPVAPSTGVPVTPTVPHHSGPAAYAEVPGTGSVQAEAPEPPGVWPRFFKRRRTRK